jgi:hypothetical protein
MSARDGTFVIVTGSSVRRVANNIGKAEFFEPDTTISPLNFLPPYITILSIFYSQGAAVNSASIPFNKPHAVLWIF